MEFMVTESQAEEAIEHALYIYEHFIKYNETVNHSDKFSKIIISGQTNFEDGYRKNISMMEEEFIYIESDDKFHVFKSNRFGEFTLHELAILISHLDEEFGDTYFE